MFLHLSCHSIHGAGGLYPSMYLGRGCVKWGSTPPDQRHPQPEAATEVGTTHPIGMHSCFIKNLENGMKPVQMASQQELLTCYLTLQVAHILQKGSFYFGIW